MINFDSMNTLPKIARSSWPVMERFYTIQGEGYYSGRPAYFIRTGGCDVGCVWCDVKESWEADKHPDTSVDQLISDVLASGTDFVVITGGEPAMYDLSLLVNTLQSKGIEVAIETSGCYALSAFVDWYCFSPKKFKAPTNEAYLKANELKIVIFHPSDFEWAEGHAKLVSDDCKLYLQPEWSKQAQILPLLIEYVKKNPKWCISLQTHKFMNIP
jgi:organic radical activating enzyme